MRKIRVMASFIILSLFVIVNYAYADTEVSGNITDDTTWTLANSPYIVTGDINIFPDVQLTVEAGTIVKLNYSIKMWIKGRLVAEGTSSNYISFISNSDNYWDSIYFDEESSGTIKYCKIEKADTGIYVNTAPVEISNNEIKDNITYGIFVYDVDEFLSISSNVIFGNSTGILIRFSGYWEDIEVIVTNNIISNGNVGIEIYASNVDLEHNTILKNSYGVKIDKGLFDHLMRFNDNEVSSNEIGIQICGEITYLKHNNILDNNNYALENTCSGEIDASNNWWGTTDTPAIFN